MLDLIGRPAVFGNVPVTGNDVLVTPAPAESASSCHRSVGLHTRLPDGFFASIYISDYFGPLWGRWGKLLMAEAARLSGHVILAPSLRGTAGDR